MVLLACTGAGAPARPAAGPVGADDVSADDAVGACRPPPSGEQQPWLEGQQANEVVLNAEEPRIEAVVYPRPDYEGNPWSQWSQGLVLSDGRFLSAIGDHRATDGNAYLYEYDPESGTLTIIADVLSLTDHQPGTVGYGKVHGQMAPGPCGEVYFTTYWGDRDSVTYTPSYRGDLLFRLDPAGRTIANLGVPVEERGVPSLTGWPEGGLLYGEAAVPSDQTRGEFFVYDSESLEVLLRTADPTPVGFRNVAVDQVGRAYYSMGGGRLAVYDPETNEVSVHPHSIPGEWLRASTRPAPDGTVYGVTIDDVLFALQPSGEIRTLGPARGYTASLALHPDGSRFFYVPEAHGGSWQQGTPLLSVDTATGEETVIAELNAMAEATLGLRLGGTYNVAVDPSGEVVYVGMNAGPPAAESAFGDVVLMIVHLS